MSPSRGIPERRRNGPVRWMALSAAIVALGLTLSSTGADAISSYNSASTSCGAIKSAVNRLGAILVMWTSSRTGNLNYKRIVRNAGYCNANQTTAATSVPAANTKRCTVYHCVSRRAYDPFD